jgi:hypothetical protein
MYIVFFTYDRKDIYFGVTAGGQLTKPSTNRDEVAHELAHLQTEEWRDEQEPQQKIRMQEIPHRQAYVRRSCLLIDGKWTIVDEFDGAVSIFVELETPAYYVLMKADMTQIHVANGPDNAKAIAGYITSALKPQ